MKFIAINSVFKYTWEQVATGLWQRYPNPNSTHVLSEDVLSRYIEGDTMKTRRLFTKTSSVPKWGERLVGKENKVFIIEESIIDIKSKTLTTYTWNLGLQKIMSIEEKCVYKVSPDNKGWTVCDRYAWVTSKLMGFRRPVEIFGLKRFNRNAHKTYQGFDYVLTGLFKPDQLKEHPLVTNKLRETARETARKAAEIAKSKANPAQILGSASASS